MAINLLPASPYDAAANQQFGAMQQSERNRDFALKAFDAYQQAQAAADKNSLHGSELGQKAYQFEAGRIDNAEEADLNREHQADLLDQRGQQDTALQGLVGQQHLQQLGVQGQQREQFAQNEQQRAFTWRDKLRQDELNQAQATLDTMRDQRTITPEQHIARSNDVQRGINGLAALQANDQQRHLQQANQLQQDQHIVMTAQQTAAESFRNQTAPPPRFHTDPDTGITSQLTPTGWQQVRPERPIVNRQQVVHDTHGALEKQIADAQRVRGTGGVAAAPYLPFEEQPIPEGAAAAEVTRINARNEQARSYRADLVRRQVRQAYEAANPPQPLVRPDGNPLPEARWNDYQRDDMNVLRDTERQAAALPPVFAGGRPVNVALGSVQRQIQLYQQYGSVSRMPPSVQREYNAAMTNISQIFVSHGLPPLVPTRPGG